MSKGALVILAAALSFIAAAAGAQSAAGRLLPPKERVHPELVDSTWEPRIKEAWDEAHADNLRKAYAIFDSLRHAQPSAVEPRMGLAFVARAEKEYGMARRWYRTALDVDPDNKQASEQLNQVLWDRPAEIELQERGDAQSGGLKISHYGSVVLPLAQGMTVNGSVGLFGAGDPLATFFARTGDTTGHGYVASGGFAWTPIASYTLDTYYERWAIDRTLAEYVYTDVALPIGDGFVGHLNSRLTFAGEASTILGGGLDWPFAERHLLSLEFYHSTHSTPIEAQAQTRVFEQYTPNPQWDARVGLVFDIDPHLAAQTLATTLAHYFTPVFGLRGEVTGRIGSGAQLGFAAAVVRRW